MREPFLIPLKTNNAVFRISNAKSIQPLAVISRESYWSDTVTSRFVISGNVACLWGNVKGPKSQTLSVVSILCRNLFSAPCVVIRLLSFFIDKLLSQYTLKRLQSYRNVAIEFNNHRRNKMSSV